MKLSDGMASLLAVDRRALGTPRHTSSSGGEAYNSHQVLDTVPHNAYNLFRKQPIAAGKGVLVDIAIYETGIAQSRSCVVQFPAKEPAEDVESANRSR